MPKKTKQTRKKPQMNTQKRSILRHGLILGAVGAGMLGMAYGFVPLYETFCKFVGIPVPTLGTNSKPAIGGDVEVDPSRTITVRFVGNVGDHLPIDFGPQIPSVRIHPGEPVLTAYKARNNHDAAIKGLAIHTMISMGKATQRDVSGFVDLVQCFCFDEQVYPAKEDVNLPLSFTIRPDLPKGIHTITFGYTLYEYPE